MSAVWLSSYPTPTATPPPHARLIKTSKFLYFWMVRSPLAPARVARFPGSFFPLYGWLKNSQDLPCAALRVTVIPFHLDELSPSEFPRQSPPLLGPDVVLFPDYFLPVVRVLIKSPPLPMPPAPLLLGDPRVGGAR